MHLDVKNFKSESDMLSVAYHALEYTDVVYMHMGDVQVPNIEQVCNSDIYCCMVYFELYNSMIHVTVSLSQDDDFGANYPCFEKTWTFPYIPLHMMI